jgi:hypothetical protein
MQNFITEISFTKLLDTETVTADFLDVVVVSIESNMIVLTKVNCASFLWEIILPIC